MRQSRKDTVICQLFPETIFCGIGMGTALSGGETRGLKNHRTVAVSGVRDTIRVLDQVEMGMLKDVDLLECTVCPDGCVGGPLAVENRFLAKSRILRLVNTLGERTVVDSSDMTMLYHKDFLSFRHPVRPVKAPPLDADPARAIRKARRRNADLQEAPAQGLRGLRRPGLPDPGRRHRPRPGGPRRLPVHEGGEAMNLAELVERLDLTIYTGRDELARAVGGGYAGDLLSDVIAHGRKDQVWVTIQIHPNIVAVAVLKELAAIVVANGREPAAETVDRARKEQVPILGTTLTAFEIAGRLHGLGIRGD